MSNDMRMRSLASGIGGPRSFKSKIYILNAEDNILATYKLRLMLILQTFGSGSFEIMLAEYTGCPNKMYTLFFK